MAFPISLKPAMASIIAAALMLLLNNVQLVRGTRTGVNHTSPHSPTSSAGGTTVTGLTSGFWPYQSYKSSPFNPPQLQITRNGQPLAPGLLFLSPENVTPLGGAKDVAPLIHDRRWTACLEWAEPECHQLPFHDLSRRSYSDILVGYKYGRSQRWPWLR